MRNPQTAKQSIDTDKDTRKKFFSYASQLYYQRNNDTTAEIQLLFNQTKYIATLTKDPPPIKPSSYGTGGDNFSAPAACSYVKGIFSHYESIKQVKTFDITPPGSDTWTIVLVYKGDRILGDEAQENLIEYGSAGSKTLELVSQPLAPAVSQSDYWQKTPSPKLKDDKSQEPGEGTTPSYNRSAP